MVENVILSAGADALLRGEQVSVCHVTRVPATVDLFGARVRPHYRCVCVWPDGRWRNDVPLAELQPIGA